MSARHVAQTAVGMNRLMNPFDPIAPSILRTIEEMQRMCCNAAKDPGIRGHAHDPEGAGEAGERFGCSATDSVHQQAVRGGCMRRRPVDSTHRSLAAF